MNGREYRFNDDGSTEVSVPDLPRFEKIFSSDGPLGDVKQVGAVSFYAMKNGASTGHGTIENNQQSLIFSFENKPQVGVEMREYNDKMYVYVIHSSIGAKGEYFCSSFSHDADRVYDNKVHNDICAVGYFWR